MNKLIEKKKILIIEDEIHIAEGVKLNLTLQGYEVLLAENGVEGIASWQEWRPDLIVLDLMLPKMDGYSVLKKIRMDDEKLPILVLSAKDTSIDKVKCLQFGVDDYLTKPFDLDEFLLRVKRLLIHSSWYKKTDEIKETVETYSFGPNMIDFKKNMAHTSLKKVNLTNQELKILKIFIANKGRSIDRQDLLELAWGYDKSTSTRTLDNFIVRLRKYFEKDPKKPIYFKSVRSVGYIFDH